MRKTNFLKVIFLSLSFAFISFAKPSNNTASTVVLSDSTAVRTEENASMSATLYQQMNLDAAGLSIEALDYAIKGYQKLVDAGMVTNDQYLTVVDFSQSSRKKRFYLLDMKNHELILNTFVSHGKNTGVDQAERFSNRMNSEQSSLGFYVTGDTYTGKHGLSLRLSGKEDGFNSNAEARGIVVHGASYVNSARVNSGYMGRSQGCPALPEGEYASVINKIKNGSVLFIYHPDQNYVQQSSLLNS